MNLLYMIYFFLVLKIVGVGLVIGRLGEDKKGKYTGSDLVINVFFSFLFGYMAYLAKDFNGS